LSNSKTITLAKITSIRYSENKSDALNDAYAASMLHTWLRIKLYLTNE